MDSTRSTARNNPLQFQPAKILLALGVILVCAALAAPVIAATTASTPTATIPTATTPTTKTTATTPTTPTTTTTTTPTTTTPTPAPLHWNKAQRLEPTQSGGLDAVSCVTTPPSTAVLCVAVDQAGDAVTTTNPSGGNGSWSHPFAIDAGTPLTGVSCPATNFCVAVDQNGDVLTSTAPTHGPHAWSKPTKIDTATAPGGGSVGLTGISCPTATLCVAVDGAAKGNVLISTAPTGGVRSWVSTTIATGPLTSVSCASGTLCVAAGDQHYFSTSPTAGASAWKATGGQVGGGVFSAIACPSASLCVGVGYGNTSTGLATATTAPHAGANRWKTVDVEAIPPVPGEGLLDTIGCASATLCVAVDGQDNAYTTTQPYGGAWSGTTPIRPSSASYTSAVSCTATLCVVVDSAGVETTGVVRG